MKKLIPLLLLLLVMTDVKSQIVMETSVPVNSSQQLPPTCFQLSYYSYLGYKYSYWDPVLSQITIYDMNHAVNRVFSVPQLPNGTPMYLTTKLFDTDSTDFEYLLLHYNGTVPVVTVYDESGTSLFQRDSFYITPSYPLNTPPNLQQYAGVIAGTTSGSKMILSNTTSSAMEIYSLPGVFPCLPCGNPAGPVPPLSVNDSAKKSAQANPYPNPAHQSVIIPYQLPDGVRSGEIVFYDSMGQEVKRFKVDRQFKDILVSVADLAAGTYYYELQTSAGAQGSRTLVVVAGD